MHASASPHPETSDLRPCPRLLGRIVPILAAALFLSAIAVEAATNYVGSGGSHTPPYDTWETAATNIQTAVDFAGTNAAYDTVMITNGTYTIAAQINVTNAITVRSVEGGLSGAGNTIVQRADTAGAIRVVYLEHADAVLEGLTIRNGYGVNGAGVYCVQGTIRHCIIRDNWHSAAISGIGVYIVGAEGRLENSHIINNYNTAGSGNNRGGGIYAGSTAVFISNCRIVSNRLDFGATKHGGGVRGGTLRNCLLAWNSAGQSGGGAYESILENCTVVGNRAAQGGGGVSACTVKNSIVTDNESWPYPLNANWSGGTFTHSLTWPLPVGSGNLDADPRFRDALGGDFRLLPASPGRDGGAYPNDAWMSDATDLDGAARVWPTGGTNDMGCTEYATGNLLGDFAADQTAGLVPLTVNFSVAADGTNLTGLTYYWDYDGDGEYDEAGADKASVATTYTTPGDYTVSLLVSNAVGETHLLTKTGFITVSPAILYVQPNGSHTLPYDTWEKAATNIPSAVALAAGGAEVVVSNHTYVLSSQIVVERGVTVRSANGAEVTIVDGNNVTRGFFVNHPDAVLDGFTVRNCNPGQPGAYGSGICLARGTVRRCRIVGNAVRGDGGGVYMLDGTVLEDSEILNNSGSGGQSFGPGVYCDNGLIQRCIVQGNGTLAGTRSRGGGMYLANGAVARNCLIAGNTSVRYAGGSGEGGGVWGGTIENCTVVGNHALFYNGGGGGTYGTTVTNSIVVFNLANTVDNNYSGGSFAYSCTTPLPAGEGNIADDPLFVDVDAGDFRLDTLSPCMDTGTNVPWVVKTGTTDLAGNSRVVFARMAARVDMGAYEKPQPRLECDFVAQPVKVLAGQSVTFTAVVFGSATEGLGFHWDFNNDGGGDAVGQDLAVVTNEYMIPGFYSVKLSVTNDAGDTAVRLREVYVAVSPPILYVATNGAHDVPYDNWTRAATNLQAALDLGADGAVIWVGAGVYPITSPLTVLDGITLRGLNGPDATLVNGGNVTRGFFIDHPDAVLAGFTVTNGNSGATGIPGSGVYLARGTVRNCRIVGNAVRGDGGGVYMLDGTVLEDSEILNNTGSGSQSFGPGVYCDNGLIQRCIVQGNGTLAGTRSRGGGMYLANGAVARNCLIVGNTSVRYAGGSGEGGGVWGGMIENCTVAGNHALLYAAGGGGTSGTTVTNSIVVFNLANDATNNYAGGSFTYTCTTPLPGTGEGNIDADPLFRDADGGDFRLSYWPVISPGIDAGTNLAWMVEAMDLDGLPRVRRGRIHQAVPAIVDLGAYEFNPPQKGVQIQVR